MNDQIIKVNNIDVTNADCHSVVQAILNSHGSINMVIRRRKPTITRAVQPVHLNLSGGKGNDVILLFLAANLANILMHCSAFSSPN